MILTNLFFFEILETFLGKSKMDKKTCPFFNRPKKSWKNEKMRKYSLSSKNK